MKYIVVTKDPEIKKATKGAFQPEDICKIYSDWKEALEDCSDADMMFVDLIATLSKPHRIRGFEEFAKAKMQHQFGSIVPLILIAPPSDYELDFMTGYPNFVFGHLRRPIDFKILRRASTWV